MELSQEQVTRIASSILISDVVSYINSYPQEYEDCLNEEYQKGKITEDEFKNELELIKNIKKEVNNNGIISRICEA